VIDELDRTWKEMVMDNLKYYPCICLEVLRKTMKTLSPGVLVSGQRKK
jgi:hypothetical protein